MILIEVEVGVLAEVRELELGEGVRGKEAGSGTGNLPT